MCMLCFMAHSSHLDTQAAVEPCLNQLHSVTRHHSPMIPASWSWHDSASRPTLSGMLILMARRHQQAGSSGQHTLLTTAEEEKIMLVQERHTKPPSTRSAQHIALRAVDLHVGEADELVLVVLDRSASAHCDWQDSTSECCLMCCHICMVQHECLS